MNSGQSFHLLGCLLMFAAALGTDQMPRLTFRKGDSSRRVFSFHRKGVQNYDTFLLSKDGGTLYVGARDVILALDIGSPDSIRLKGEILWGPTSTKKDECVFKKKSNETECFNFIRVLVQLNDTHLYACGTYAFSPTCTYIDLENFTLATDANGKTLLLEGKGICPFDPQHQNTAIVVDGELYTGTRNNFQGNEAIITRTLGSRTVLKTDNWLHGDAAFVASFNIPVDDKVYFFFGETAKEFDFFEKLTVSRVARVCKNDVGGDKVLQRKWTTFLKAQLSCTQQGQFPYTVIQHMFALPQPGGGADFYGVFGSQWQAGNFGSSAVCAFRHDAIKKAFDGKYKELNKDCSRWMTYNGEAMNPRPGSCSVGPSSDKALTFMKDHYLMDEKIEPTHNKPLLVKQNIKYTQIVVHQTQNSLGHPYNVMFLGTDKGALHKAVVVGTEAHIIEEIKLFEKPEAVQNLLLVPEKGILYVGYSTGVLQVPLANCSIYTTCANCVLARDPYCAWDGQKCQDIRGATENLNDLVQNIETGKPDPGCQSKSGIGRAMPRIRSGPEGSLLTIMTASFNTMVRLPCPQSSALANYSWNYPDRKIPDRLILEDDKALVIIVHEETLGLYECWASENGYQQSVARYHVRTHDSPARMDRARESYADADGEPVGEYRSYWVQFVTVTVLLSMTLAVVVALAFFSYHDKLKARSKVQGCSSLPDPSKASGQEKVPLNSSQSPPQSSECQMQGSCQEAADSSKTCCVEVGGVCQDIDADNNRLDSGLVNGDDSRADMAAEGI